MSDDIELAKRLRDYGQSMRDGLGFKNMPSLFNSAAAAIKRLTAQVAKLDRSETQLIGERDEAEQCVSDIYFMMTGKSAEWRGSTAPGGGFRFKQALEELADVRHGLDDSIKRLTAQVEMLKGLGIEHKNWCERNECTCGAEREFLEQQEAAKETT